MFTEEELDWIRKKMSDSEVDEVFISPSYFYKKQTVMNREKNRKIVRKELDRLRKDVPTYSPEMLLKLKTQTERTRHNIIDFSGVYIIHNIDENKYYIGKGDSIFKRVVQHFEKDKGNPGVYRDYKLGCTFSVNLIPLSNTQYSSLNELEDNAIRAYDSFNSGYNLMAGNVLDKTIFKHDNHLEVAELILEKIKNTEQFSSLTNKRKRMSYIANLLNDHDLPKDFNFIIDFADLIKEYQKNNRKAKK